MLGKQKFAQLWNYEKLFCTATHCFPHSLPPTFSSERKAGWFEENFHPHCILKSHSSCMTAYPHPPHLLSCSATHGLSPATQQTQNSVATWGPMRIQPLNLVWFSFQWQASVDFWKRPQIVQIWLKAGNALHGKDSGWEEANSFLSMDAQTMAKLRTGRGILLLQKGLISDSIKMKQLCSTVSFANLRIQSQDVSSAARGTTRLKNMNPASGHLILLKHLLRGDQCNVQNCCWGLSSWQRDPNVPSPEPHSLPLLVSPSEESDRTSHLEGTCRQEQCDSTRPMASTTWSRIAPPPAALQLYYYTFHCLIPGKLPAPDQPPSHFKIHSC